MFSQLGSTSRTDVVIDVDGSPAVGAILIEFDAVGIAFVPQLDDLPGLPGSDVGFDGVSDRKAELLRTARLKAFLEKVSVEILPDEDEAAGTLLTFLPLGTDIKGSREHHTNALEDKLGVHALDGDDTLVAVEVGPIFRDETLNPPLHHGDIDFSGDDGGHTVDRTVVLMFRIRIEELGFKIEDTFEVKGSNVEKFLGTDDSLLAAEDGSIEIERLDALLDGHQLVFRGQIRLVQNNLIGKDDLFHGLILHSFGLLVVETVDDVLGIHHGNDGIEVVHFLNVIVDEKGLDDGSRIGQASGLNDDAIEFLDLLVQPLESLDEVATDRAANAAVHDLDDFLVDILRNNLFVDANVTELVLNDSELHSVSVVIENVVHERGLA
jgi:hypothetical protein